MANPFVHVELNTTDVAKANQGRGAMFLFARNGLPGSLFVFTSTRRRWFFP